MDDDSVLLEVIGNCRISELSMHESQAVPSHAPVAVLSSDPFDIRAACRIEILRGHVADCPPAELIFEIPAEYQGRMLARSRLQPSPTPPRNSCSPKRIPFAIHSLLWALSRHGPNWGHCFLDL